MVLYWVRLAGQYHPGGSDVEHFRTKVDKKNQNGMLSVPPVAMSLDSLDMGVGNPKEDKWIGR